MNLRHFIALSLLQLLPDLPNTILPIFYSVLISIRVAVKGVLIEVCSKPVDLIGKCNRSLLS